MEIEIEMIEINRARYIEIGIEMEAEIETKMEIGIKQYR